MKQDVVKYVDENVVDGICDLVIVKIYDSDGETRIKRFTFGEGD